VGPWRRRLLGLGLALVVGVPACGLGAIEILYRVGVSRVGELPEAPRASTPPLLADVLWIAAGGRAEDTVEPVWPWTYANLMWRVGTEGRRATEPPGMFASTLAARVWLKQTTTPTGGMLRWHTTFLALTMWFSRHWTKAELTQFFAERAFFGRHAVGVEAAAQAYFRKSAPELDPAEAGFVAQMMLDPSHDPSCDHERLPRGLWQMLHDDSALFARIVPPATGCRASPDR
jgi:hypothetical protein